MVNVAPEVRYTEQEHLEKSILSSVIHDEALRQDFKVLPKYFSDQRHAEIAQRILDNPGLNKADLITSSVSGEDKSIGDYNFIRDVVEYSNSSNKNFIFNQEMLLKSYKNSEANKAINEFQNSGEEHKIQDLSSKLNDIRALELDNASERTAVISEIFEDIHNTEEPKIISTGFSQLDNLIDGFEPQQFNVLAARPSMGKTAFALQLAINFSRKDSQVIFCSIESSQKNITQRILSNLSGVPLRKFKRATDYMRNDDIDKVINAMDDYYKLDLSIDDSHVFTPEKIRRIARNSNRDKNVIIMIDYLQLMKADDKKVNRYEEVSEISRELKIIAAEFKNVTIVAIAQLSRAVDTRQDKKPVMSDIRETGQIEQDANLIMFLYREDYYKESPKQDSSNHSEMNLSIAKNKDGPQGNVNLKFYPVNQRIY